MEMGEAKPAGISDLEWRARIDLAAAFRLVELHGWSDLLATIYQLVCLIQMTNF